MGDAAVNRGPVIRFSRSLYEPPAVHAAVAAYAAFGTWEVTERDDEIEVILDGDPDLLDHFANHVLFETIRLQRAASAGSTVESTVEGGA